MMTRKARRNASVAVPLQPLIAETRIPHDPVNVRIVRRELQKLAHQMIGKDGDNTALRRKLSSDTIEELWEVPG
jgi:hypothetical protein